MPQRIDRGSVWVSTQVPKGTATSAPAAITNTPRRSAWRQASGIMPNAPTPSIIIRIGAASSGPTLALASGMKLSADPKPEKPRASPAIRPAAARNTSVPVGAVPRPRSGRVTIDRPA